MEMQATSWTTANSRAGSWHRRFSDVDGAEYYENEETGVTRWGLPVGADLIEDDDAQEHFSMVNPSRRE